MELKKMQFAVRKLAKWLQIHKTETLKLNFERSIKRRQQPLFYGMPRAIKRQRTTKSNNQNSDWKFSKYTYFFDPLQLGETILPKFWVPRYSKNCSFGSCVLRLSSELELVGRDPARYCRGNLSKHIATIFSTVFNQLSVLNYCQLTSAA